MSQWGTSDSGILRKNKVDENLDQLLVFGYSCKIFRDNEKALYIDQGKHLIPWMGDETLKIDRYDGRGALSDLRQYEASREGYDALRWMGLSETEKKLEELCDTERYYSLEINEEEEEMYKEVAKRQKTNAIGFNYDSQGNTEDTVAQGGIPTVPEKEEEDEPYKPSPVLDVPININIPQTVKVYARIEKTALFVCRQGPQMEILIKAKQADNPQFSFLTVNDPLYKFYRHVLSAFKNGRYQPQCEKRAEESEPAENQDDDQYSHYLHPSLVSAGAKPEAPPLPKNPPIPNVPYRPTADCAYSQLVNRIQGAGINIDRGVAMQNQGVSVQQGDVVAQMSMEQQYHHYYYVQQFYEYWRHAVVSGEQGALYATLPMDFGQLDQNMQSYIHQMAWTQFAQHYQKQMQETQEAQVKATNNSYAQIVSNLNKDGVNPYTANVPQLPPPEPKKEEAKTVCAEEKQKEERTVTMSKLKESKVKKPLLFLAAAYGSGSETESNSSNSESESEETAAVSTAEKNKLQEQIEVYRVPFGETQTVIDKMADYVFKNGAPFEAIIRDKRDPRFEFLNEGHEFNKYYRAKLRELTGVPEHKRVKENVVKKKSPKTKKIIAPVSFSIKKPKDDPPKEIKSALPMEDSSDEEEGYLDHLPKSPAQQANGNNVQKVAPVASSKIGPTVYRVSAYNVPQPKIAQLTTTSKTEEDKSSSSPKLGSPSPKRRSSRSSTASPTRSKISRSPRKRSISPRKSKKSKSRSRSPKKISPPRRSPRRSSVDKSHSPTVKIESDRTTSRKKKLVIDMFDVDRDEKQGECTKKVNERLENDPILEMLELNEEKNAEEKAADAREKARQLERKQKAAMFLKLKSAETSKATTTPVKNETTSPGKSEKSSPIKSERSSKMSPRSSSISSRRDSEDSVQIISSRSGSRTKERSNGKERSKSRDKSRSRSKEKKKESKRRKKSKEKERSRDKVKKEKKKKSHKRKHSKSNERDSKSKKKSKKHKRSRTSPSKSRSISRVKSISRSRSRSGSLHSHISIASS